MFWVIKPVDQLTQHAGPVFGGLIAADAVHRQLIVAVFANALVVGTAQHFHDVPEAEALADAVHAGQRLARVLQPVVALGRIEANVAVAAVLVLAFAEVVEQHQTAAGLRLGERAHGVQLVALDIQLLSGGFFLRAAAQPSHVGRIVQQDGFGRQACSARPVS